MHFHSIALPCLFFAAAYGAATPASLFEERSKPGQGIPVCTTEAATPKPHYLRCGAQGSLANPMPIVAAFEADDFQSCRDTCINTSECVSFSFNQDNFQCNEYSKAIKNQDFSRDPTTQVFFYNRACYKITCTCPGTGTLCGTYCAHVLRDESNCGACGNVCGQYEACVGGTCTPTTCTNVIDCDNGVSGSDVTCGSNRCFCADSDGATDSGFCVIDSSCDTPARCDSTTDCKRGYVCSKNTCCSGKRGLCNKINVPTCANPTSPTTVFKRPKGSVSHKTQSGR